MLAFPLIGFALFMQAGSAVIEARLEPTFAGDSLLTEVRIADFPVHRGDTVSFIVEPIDDMRLPPRSRVTWFEPERAPALGEIWQLELRLKAPRGNSNPGLFSLEDWMFREKLHAAGYVVPGKRNQHLTSGAITAVDRFRAAFVANAEQAAGSSAPVIAAVGVGARHRISREQWDRYAATGTSHLMAISGLHIGLAAATAFAIVVFAGGLLRWPGNHLDHAVVIAAAVACVYGYLSGLLLPSQRAITMLCLAAVAVLTRRRVDPGRTVALSALLLYVLDPLSILTPGFSLSFGAVAALLWFGRQQIRLPAVNPVRQLLAMQVTLLFGLMPLTVIFFQRVAFAAPLANLISVPVFSFATVPLVLASVSLQPVSASASEALLVLAGHSVRLIEAVIALMAALPYSYRDIAGIDGHSRGIVCVVFLPLLWVLLPRGFPGRWIAIVAVAALLLHRPAPPPNGCVDAHVLDVGQGLAVVVQSHRRTLLFDTGASYRSGGSAAQQVILPFLRHRGVEFIDWLVVSHADNDHAGGVSAMVSGIDIGQIFTGEPLAGNASAATLCEAGRSWQADGVLFRILYPGANQARDGNNASCVLEISVGSHRLLLTGDIERDAEARLLRDGRLRAVSVLLIPHHGSLTSSTPAFVDRVRPQLAVASAGFGNRWDFPKARVEKRWQGAGANVLDTATSGAVSIRLCANGGIQRVRQERLRRWRFWHTGRPAEYEKSGRFGKNF